MPGKAGSRAVSKAQQAKMAVCLHFPSHAKGGCPKMTKAEMREFAETPTKNLPKHAPKK